MVRVFAQKPEWHLLLSLGRHLRVEELGTLPPNVHATASVPQLAVLERARVMVTHGGLGSVKECIQFGVPMLVIPLAIDQPGNAARVAYHGLGLHGDVTSSTDELSELLAAVLGDARYRTRTLAMQTRFREVEGAMRGADLVEAMASGE
jgi:zeaxanthin glucosyltransferase